MSAWEIGQIAAIETAGAARASAAVLDGLITIASMAQSAAAANFGAAVSASIGTATAPAVIARSVVNGVAAEADAQAQVLSLGASFQRRENDWALSRDLAALDEGICDEQIAIANDHVVVANQVGELDPLKAFSNACRNELLAGQV